VFAAWGGLLYSVQAQAWRELCVCCSTQAGPCEASVGMGESAGSPRHGAGEHAPRDALTLTQLSYVWDGGFRWGWVGLNPYFMAFGCELNWVGLNLALFGRPVMI
jgi:hypothetical protein